ncbi:hypothetical protein E2C01_094457 [Portunus trituberculatus]|uniref:Uncharacterized protein n=1 Tax=Portunus trituberculatus TaxID=210409 RepID=A0A5B7JSH4_PORTR|nr:hypothetical protein [Portunus trituberculatus]
MKQQQYGKVKRYCNVTRTTPQPTPPHHTTVHHKPPAPHYTIAHRITSLPSHSAALLCRAVPQNTHETPRSLRFVP